MEVILKGEPKEIAAFVLAGQERQLPEISAKVAEILAEELTRQARLHSHPLGPLLWGPPNEVMTRFDYERLMQCNLDLSGNAYAWIERDGRTGRPVELIPLRLDSVTPYITPAGTLWYIYTNPRTGELTRLSPEDVLHYKASLPES